MEAEKLANICEKAIHAELDSYTALNVYKFTPSIMEGRRYVGVAEGDKIFKIEVSVKRV